MPTAMNTHEPTQLPKSNPENKMGATPTSAPNKTAKAKVRKLLLIEDDLDMGGILANNLSSRYNCKVDLATDPYEAIDKMTENFYDMVILDWNLPALTGGETLRQVEKAMFFEPTLPIQWDNHEVPVIIFSSDRRQECPLRKSKHFNYVGFVSKVQPLGAIVENFGEYLNHRDGKGIWAS